VKIELDATSSPPLTLPTTPGKIQLLSLKPLQPPQKIKNETEMCFLSKSATQHSSSI
jgi:hypothetical protein